MGTQERILLFVILTVLSAVAAYDMIDDYLEGSSSNHIATEGIMFFLSIGGLGLILRELYITKKETEIITRDLEKTESDLLKWRKEAQKYIEGLSLAIERQFARWKFTPAETEIGFLLLKGFSFKEIAKIRKTSERTVRQQSLEIYKKSGLAGRVELSAFFLEDLLPPE